MKWVFVLVIAAACWSESIADPVLNTPPAASSPALPTPQLSLPAYRRLIPEEVRAIDLICRSGGLFLYTTYWRLVAGERVVMRRDIACQSPQRDAAILIMCNHTEGSCLVMPTKHPAHELEQVIHDAALLNQ